MIGRRLGFDSRRRHAARKVDGGPAEGHCLARSALKSGLRNPRKKPVCPDLPTDSV
jgi:hypothetical protein